MIAKEGIREISIATILLGGAAWLAWWWLPALAFIPIALWIWVIAFFRDPPRHGTFGPGDLCAPADGTVTEITRIPEHPVVGGPAVRIGIFLSLFNVHVNRSSCSGTVRAIAYKAGEFLDARHPESGRRNEQNTLLIDPDAPLPGPVEITQIAGLVARRIICRAKANEQLTRGARFGLIKFGSRTELVIPDVPGTMICVEIGDKVKAGITVVARQPVDSDAPSPRSEHQGTAAR